MIDTVLVVVMVLASGAAGYGIRALQHPVQKRGKNGRFTK